eukprot:721607-Alexandrium_andersonii.AAC.1
MSNSWPRGGRGAGVRLWRRASPASHELNNSGCACAESRPTLRAPMGVFRAVPRVVAFSLLVGPRSATSFSYFK